MKKTRVILLLSIILVNLSAQITDNKIEFTKPSIEAASLGVYGNMDVSKYTGRLNVNVPIYQIKTQRISLPISLSYNTSGVRLTDIAGWVGLNWSLNAGGIITRTVIGDADPIGIVPYETNMIEPDIKTMKFKDIYVCTASNMNTEPDIFNYNFLGYSGQFVIDSKGGIILSNPNHIKISPQPDGNGWVIYTKEGHKLYFNKEERVKTTSVYETRCVFGNWTDTPDSHSDNLNITAWYLTKIEDIQTNDYIELFYSNIKSVNETQSSRTYYTPLDVIVKPLEMGKTWIKREEIVPLLDSIVFAEGKVEFIKESGRLDYSDQESGCKLTEIKISSKDSKSLSYLFQSSYKSNRLILNAITRSNSNNQKEKYYSFEYDNQEMPDRDSPARDFWGYFNGRTQNSYYVPAYLEYKGDDWSPNPLTMKALSLNKITYPTGGYTYIELEPHEYSMDKEGERLTFSNTGKNVQKDFSKNFKNFIDYDRYKPKWDTLTIEGSTQTVCVSNNFPDNSFVLQIRKQNAAHEHIGAYSNGNYQVVLTKGIYEAALIDTEQNNDIEIPSQYESTIFYVKSSSSNKSIAGGLRVKKLTNVSEKGKVEVKKYEYQLSGTPYSSGIQTWSNLFYCDDFYVLKEINTLTYERYKIRNSDLVNSQELMRNSPVVYKEVKEITEGDGYEGCIISKYSTIVDYPDYYFNPSAIIGKAKVPGSFPFMFEPINFNDWARGQVIEEIILNNKNETVKKSTFNYNIIPRTSVKGRKFGFALPPTGVFNDEDHCKICITDYFITVGFTELSERIDTSYFYHNNTLSYLTQKMNYNYEPINNLLIEESVQESIKNRVSNQYYYPSNIPNSFFIPASNYNELTESCLFGKLVGNTRKINDIQVDGYFYDYANGRNPKIFYKLTNDGFTKEACYDYENNYLSEIKSKSGVASVIRDKYRRVVATVQNGSITEVKNALNSNYLLITCTENQNLIEGKINELRVSLPKAQITSYKYKFLDGVETIVDPNNVYTYNEYDGFGRLAKTKNDNHDIVTEYSYHLSGENYPNYVELHIKQPENGKIETDHIFIEKGESATILIKPNKNYIIKQIWVNGVEKGPLHSITLQNIDEDQYISAEMLLNNYNIISTSGIGGSISPSCSVQHGSSKTFTITPSTGYHITNVKVDGVSKGVIGSYTFSNVTATHTIHADFKKNMYKLIIMNTTGGSVNPSTSQIVEYGGSVILYFTPNEGYKCKNVYINNVPNPTFNGHLTDIKQDYTIKFEWEKEGGGGGLPGHVIEI